MDIDDEALTNLDGLGVMYRERLFHHSRFHPEDLSTRHLAPPRNAPEAPLPHAVRGSPPSSAGPLPGDREGKEGKEGKEDREDREDEEQEGAAAGGGFFHAGISEREIKEGGEGGNVGAAGKGGNDATSDDAGSAGGRDENTVLRVWGEGNHLPCNSMNVLETDRRKGPLALLVCFPRMDTVKGGGKRTSTYDQNYIIMVYMSCYMVY